MKRAFAYALLVALIACATDDLAGYVAASNAHDAASAKYSAAANRIAELHRTGKVTPEQWSAFLRYTAAVRDAETNVAADFEEWRTTRTEPALYALHAEELAAAQNEVLVLEMEVSR